jgi:tetratricopeptide (TPR) repeat protein/TolB-like protein
MVSRRGRLAAAAAVLMMALAAGWMLRRPAAVPPKASRLTVAVFPFRSIPAGDDQLLELGLAEVLIGRLGQLPDVTVLPLVATERRRSEDPLNAAGELGVDRVLIGTLQKQGQLVRATFQIYSTDDRQMIDSGSIDADAKSVFNIQDSIVKRLVEQLAPAASVQMRSRLAQAGTRNAEAYRAYVDARAVVFNPISGDLTRARGLFERAVALDPRYADAWAGIGTASKRMPLVARQPSGEWFPRARAAAERALEIDREHAEAQSVLGTVAFWYEWDYQKAERLLRKALELQPGSADSQLFLAHVLANTGRFDDALAEIRVAKALAPDWGLPRAHEGHFLFMARQYDEALERLTDVVKMEPQFWPARTLRVLPLLALGRYEEAIRHIDDSATLEAGQRAGPSPSGFKAYALARLGRHAEADQLLAAMKMQGKGSFATGEALVLHGLSRDQEALERLQQAVTARDLNVTFLGVYPWWDDLRNSPGFRAILQQANLLEVSDALKRRPAR